MSFIVLENIIPPPIIFTRTFVHKHLTYLSIMLILEDLQMFFNFFSLIPPYF